ncbi:MAG: MATE family efflux transporter [Enterocloster asparagiformis]|nr:MATE family efflux transporter [Enterocloster asparagiformis]
MEQKVGKTFGKYVALNVMGALGLSCYILADTYFVAAGAGAQGLAALNLAIPVYSFINGLGLMAGMGGATAYAIAGGQGDHKRRRTVFTQVACMVLAISLLFSLGGLFFAVPLSAALGADSQVLEKTSVYLRILMIFAPMFMFNNLLVCFVRNDGNPRLSMAAMVLGSLSNIVLDYVFIMIFHWGMFGAAVATGIAPIVSMLILSRHLRSKACGFGLRRGRFKPRLMGDCAALGLSSLIVEVSAGVVMIVFNGLAAAAAGNTGIAAYGVLANLALVITSIFTGIGQGIQPILSRYYGQGNKTAMNQVYGLAVAVSALFALGIYAVCAVFAHPVAGAFNRQGDPVLEAIAVRGLRIYFTGFLFAGINVVTAAFFSAVSQPGRSFAVSVLRGFVVILPMAFILSAALGLDGVWLSMPASELVVAAFCLVLYVRGKR